MSLQELQERPLVYGDRKQPRVHFEKAITTVLIGIDGTWRRECAIADISASGARLILKSSLAGLNFREFFLVLTPSGSVYRRCELIRVDGLTIGVRFVGAEKSAGPRRSPPGGG
ncbi:PilZ domain-containing protein [Rhodopseudomonas sp. NSM]